MENTISFENIYFLKKSNYKNFIKSLIKEKEFDLIDPDDQIYCAICGNTITSKSNKIEVNSFHSHSFFNPSGISYSISCFKNAKGCITQSDPTEDFTWFPGYSWQVVVCSCCKTHNGWKYTSGNYCFFGLIDNMLFLNKK